MSAIDTPCATPTQLCDSGPTADRLIRLRWGVLTDLHLAAPGTAPGSWHNHIPLTDSRDILTTGLRRLRDQLIQRLILLGDLANAPMAADYDYLFDRLAETGYSTWLVPGNHDRPDQTPHALDEHLRRHPAAVTPTTPATDLAGIVVVAGDLVAQPDVIEHYTLTMPTLPQKDHSLLVVLTHYPILDLSSTLAGANLENAGELCNRRTVAASLTEWPGPVLVLHGHQHIRCHRETANVLQLGFGALAEHPHDTAILDLTLARRNETVHDVRVVRTARTLVEPQPASQRPIIDPDEVAFRWSRAGWERSD